jgi:hypothetical protein
MRASFLVIGLLIFLEAHGRTFMMRAAYRWKAPSRQGVFPKQPVLYESKHAKIL